ncbi:MAG: ParB/RepB/Spo0J family partition protein [Aliarcobacter sp.]|jgi:ParB family chromosome partitioning protein|nr:ParB/RepB/Spo0J family partition protein [Aliarcobacter sp.]
MELQAFLNLDEQAQKNYILKLDNNEFTEFIQNVKKKNLRLSMTLSSFRQSNKNINKKDEENKLQSSSKVELYKIKDNPEQPRKIFTEVQVNEKMESIKSRGLITPITVLKKEDAFILIAGQLRLEAFKKLNQEEKNNNIDSDKMVYSKIDIFIKDDENYSNDDMAIDSLIENLNRTDMHVVDTAMAIKKILEKEKVSYTELSSMLGKSKFFISSYMAIANTEKEFIDYILKKDIKQPTIIYLILQLDKSLEEKKKLVDMYLNGEIVKTQLQEMKNEQNRNQASEEGRGVQIKNKPNTQNSFYKDIFSFKKRFDINKFEKLDTEDKFVVEEKLKQIKELQEQITNLLV